MIAVGIGAARPFPFIGFGDDINFGVKLSSIFGGGIALPV